MSNLLFLERYSPTSHCWKNLIRKRAISELSIEELVRLYQGFEGEIIDIFPIDAENNEINIITDKIKKQDAENGKIILFSLDVSKGTSKKITEICEFVGYDVGICDEDTGVYSSIFNEILFGKIDELVIFQKYLNKNLLFDDLVTARKYLSLHEQLGNQGKDVESYQKMFIYEIWQYKVGTIVDNKGIPS